MVFSLESNIMVPDEGLAEVAEVAEVAAQGAKEVRGVSKGPGASSPGVLAMGCRAAASREPPE